jgi:site-specific recombinase XerD
LRANGQGEETGRLHVLRHTFGSRLAMNAKPWRSIQALMGHANIMTTERYMHSDDSIERDAIASLNGKPSAENRGAVVKQATPAGASD